MITLTYGNAIDFIMGHRKFQKTASLERIEKLLLLLENPHKKLKFVHIVGTNGKGSTSTALSYILKEAGYKTGLFTSPFVVEFGERIQVNNEYIHKEEIVNIVSLIKEKTEIMAKEGLYPTVFEVTTALAMVYFAKKGCDIVFLEAGIGGEHDSTNVIPSPLAAVFTAISLDHTEMLGDTTEKIAKEKCGIIKEGTTVVSYPLNAANTGFVPQDEAAGKIIVERAEEKNCPFKTADSNKVKLKRNTFDVLEFTYGKLDIKTGMTGLFQMGNLLTAIETVQVLKEKGYSISDEDIEKGIEKFTIPGRTEKISENPIIIVDGGHNEASIRALKSTIESYFGNKPVTLLLSFMKDKAYETCMQELLPLAKAAVFTNVDKVRGESSKVLKEKGSVYCKNVFANENVTDALETALKITDKNAVLIVAGSFYLVSAIRKLIK